MQDSPARIGMEKLPWAAASIATAVGPNCVRPDPLPSVTDQVNKGKAYYTVHRQAGKFIAYFQTFTNTYGDPADLQRLYGEALNQADVIGLSVGTRPDCVPEETIRIFEDYARRYHVWLEFGLQSIHDRTLAFLNRGHGRQTFLDAVTRIAGRGILQCVHIIVGLPGESHEDILETARGAGRSSHPGHQDSLPSGLARDTSGRPLRAGTDRPDASGRICHHRL